MSCRKDFTLSDGADGALRLAKQKEDDMPPILQRYATPLTIGLFLVSLISGLALFFGVWPGVFHGMHELVGLVLIVPFGLHLWRNWRPLVNYFSKPAFPATIAACLVAALGIGLASSAAGGGHGPAQFALLQALTATTPAKLAPALGIDAETLVATLKARGFVNAVVDASLTDIAADAGKDNGDLASALVAAVGK